MASEIRVDKITSLSGVGTITPSSSGIDITGITTVATLKATTGIVTTLTATTGIVTTLTSNTTTLNSTTTATGNINVSGANITLQDSGGSSDDRLVFGAGSDLSIYHDGSHSRISEAGTGKLILETDGSEIQLNKGTTENMIKCFTDGAVELYYDNSKKIETTNGGATVTGRLLTDGVYIGDGGNNDTSLSIGASNDLRLYHDGSNSYILDRGTGSLIIQTSNFNLDNQAGTENILTATEDGAVELYYDGTKKFETHDRGTIFTEAGSGTTQAAIKVNTTLNDYGVITVRDRSNVNNQVSGFQVENASSGTNETNLLLRSVNLNSTAYSHGLYAAKSHKFAVSNNTTPTVQIDSDGLKFNNDQAAANALDDYEEGTFTPTYSFSSSTGTFTYDAQIGRYTKIGNRCFFSVIVRSTGHSGTSNGLFRVAGLPFNVLSDAPSGGTCFFILGGNFSANYGVATQLVTTEHIEFYKQVTSTGNNYDSIEENELNLGGLFVKVEGHYQVDQ